MIKVMFVCLGNICRSAMAECIFTDKVSSARLDKNFIIDSAGTSDEEEGNPMYSPAARKLRSEGVPLLSHRAKQLQRYDYDAFDYFLCMENSNVISAKRIFGDDPQNKVVRLLDFTKNPRDISDPWYTGNFDKAYDDIVEGCDAFLLYARSLK